SIPLTTTSRPIDWACTRSVGAITRAATSQRKARTTRTLDFNITFDLSRVGFLSSHATLGYSESRRGTASPIESPAPLPYPSPHHQWYWTAPAGHKRNDVAGPRGQPPPNFNRSWEGGGCRLSC